MTAVLGGLGAAVIWAVGSLGASRAARALGPMLTLGWVMLIGLVLTAPTLPLSRAVSPSATEIAWLVLGGTGNVGGLLLMYRALRIGRLGVVMPIVTTEGGIAALIAIAAGQSVGTIRGAALALTVSGVVMTAIARRPPAERAVSTGLPTSAGPRAVPDPTEQGDRLAAAWAVAGAFAFGIGLYATGRASAELPAAWAVIAPRVVGVAIVTLPLALTGRVRAPRAYARWLLLSGACEVGGYFSYALGARNSIPVAAVLATLTGVFGAAIGRLLFAERLRGSQLAGILVSFVGVAAISALGA